MHRPRRVLIVDDEPSIRLMFRTALESTGDETVEASDGEEALARLAASPFDLVLLDLKMPGLGGLETLRRLRERGDATPVVVVTAHGDVLDAVEAMKLGAIDFLPKPLKPADLRRVVAEASEGHREGISIPAEDRPVTVEGQFAIQLDGGKRAIRRRDFRSAEVHLRQALALRGDSAEAENLMGVLRESRGDLEGARACYRAALEAAPSFTPARQNLARQDETAAFGRSAIPVDTGDAG